MAVTVPDDWVGAHSHPIGEMLRVPTIGSQGFEKNGSPEEVYEIHILLTRTFALGTRIIAASESGTFDRTLSISGPVSLDVRSDPGGIRITSGTDASVRVHATIRPLYGRFDLGLAEANIRALERNPAIEQSGNHIRIGYVDPELLRAVSMHLTLIVPRATQARAQTSSGK